MPKNLYHSVALIIMNYLKEWISDRLDWFDSQMDQIEPAFDITGSENVATGDYQISAYPNPFTEQFTVRFKLNNKSSVKLIIRDVLGRIILNKSATYHAGYNNVTVSASGLDQNSSLLFYSVYVGQTAIQNGKLMRIE